jgi:hypothetical protein
MLAVSTLVQLDAVATLSILDIYVVCKSWYLLVCMIFSSRSRAARIQFVKQQHTTGGKNAQNYTPGRDQWARKYGSF